MNNPNQQNSNRLPNISADAYERLFLLSVIISEANLPQSKHATASAAIQRTIAHIEAIESVAQSQAKELSDLKAAQQGAKG